MDREKESGEYFARFCPNLKLPPSRVGRMQRDLDNRGATVIHLIPALLLIIVALYFWNG